MGTRLRLHNFVVVPMFTTRDIVVKVFHDADVVDDTSGQYYDLQSR